MRLSILLACACTQATSPADTAAEECSAEVDDLDGLDGNCDGRATLRLSPPDEVSRVGDRFTRVLHGDGAVLVNSRSSDGAGALLFAAPSESGPMGGVQLAPSDTYDVNDAAAVGDTVLLADPQWADGGINWGAVHVIRSDGSVSHWIGDRPGEQMARVVASAGDIDGDARADALVGSDQATAFDEPGVVDVVLAPTFDGLESLADADRRIIGPSGWSRFGASVAGAGDVDGDGLGDWLVGAPGDDSSGSATGSAYLFLGAQGEVVPGHAGHAAARWDGEAAGDDAGRVVEGAGDVDGDGYPDVLISAPLRDTVYVVYGGAEPDDAPLAQAGDVIRGPDASFLGRALAAGGDVDGDGFDDVLVSARTIDADARPGAGAAHLHFGGPDGIGPEPTRWIGEQDGDDLAATIAIGDVDADGLAELVLGAPSAFDGRGALYVVFVGERSID